MSMDYELACRLAVNLMNCKNISYEDYDPNRHLSPGASTDQPFIRYKILKINAPGSRRNQKQPFAHEQDQRPARAVRGHYKIGTLEKPLFGKPWRVGRFWCGPYVTGNPKFGLVIKDYQIELKSLKDLLEKES